MHRTSDASPNLRRRSLLSTDTIKAVTKDYLINYLEIMRDFKNHYLKGEDELIKDIENVNGDYLTALTSIGKSGASGKDEALRLMPYFNELNSHFYRILSSYNERTPHLIIILFDCFIMAHRSVGWFFKWISFGTALPCSVYFSGACYFVHTIHSRSGQSLQRHYSTEV